MIRLLILAVFVVFALTTIAIAGDSSPSDAVDCSDPSAVETTVSFSDDVMPIFSFNCVICHQTGAANASLVLEAGRAYENLVGAESTESGLVRVKPGDPESSYLYHKLTGTQADVGGSGAQMPLGLGPLPDSDLETIVTWIEQCAPNN